ncbi:hypothetical protein EIN_274490 [Entamoeba invadens IP1]|uniref:Uncharacterized protein n=1 Tax=Entamoeba invadens IP1 TaxID=370355 RepID=A0A0A1U1I3_ENTIV|nr:hypothetical protein EIN_274490 [Entamoeba invadens IP1]ELP87872.1 hypothetical protein EIN_274490 [Entamoeba invadens IP1]|eukprot:XP_004254643.1 hypothetical protein EIN_274490 [Entamoeba invadens IP1]
MHTMLFLILLLLSVSSLFTKEHHVVFTMAVGPKSHNYLHETMDYFLHAYNFNHLGIKIDLFFTKGCENCQFPEFDKELNRLSNYDFKVYNVSFKMIPVNKLEDKGMVKFQEKFESWVVDFRKDTVNEREESCYWWYIKDSKINHYAFSLARYAKQYTDADYILFLEDDILIKKDFFVTLKNVLDQYKDGKQVATRTMICQDKYNDIKVHNKQLGFCVAGFFGILLGKREFKKINKFWKYMNWGVCVDAYNCYMDDFLNMSTPMFQTAKHVGWERFTTVKDPKFWM